MIREFENGDIDRLKANKYSDAEQHKHVILRDDVEKLTLEDNGEVVAIIGMYNYWGRNWYGFFLMKDGVELSHIKELKRIMFELINIKGMLRLETLSEDCPVINRWMEFLGFDCEGTKRQYINGKDYKMMGS